MSHMNPTQLTLTGFSEPTQDREKRRPRFNYFFAAQPDVEVASHMLNSAGPTCFEHRLQRKLFAPDRLHVSLVGIAQSDREPRDLLAWLCFRVSQVSLPRFGVCFHRALTFVTRRADASGHPFVLVGNTGGFQLLRAALLECLGLHSVSARFTPHVTLLYDKQIMPEHDVTPVDWTVSGFSLIQSHVGQHRYTVLDNGLLEINERSL
jgi:2'-5' RNA ligase